jgi:alternate signal-mediated exported protein
MNKLVKGSIATAAGVALLLGGAGTFALWSDTAGVQGGTVQTGVLDIEPVANSAKWADVSVNGRTGATFDPAKDKIVPGDTVTFTQDVTLKAEGKNLKAELALGTDAAKMATQFAAQGVGTVTLGTTVTSGTATVVAKEAGKVFTVTPAATGGVSESTLRVVVTVAFNSAVANQDASNLTSAVDLTKLAFTLTQVRGANAN